MAYVDFPTGLKGQKERKAFWLSKEGLILIAGWRRQGVPLTEIAEKYIGVSKTAFFGHWYKESEDLRKACAVSLDIANAEVENSLLKRAIGYDYTEETHELVEGELRLTKVVTKHVPADVKAILSWLYNRLPNRWRAIQEPIESTQYTETIKNILVAMQEVAESGESKEVEVKESAE
jgi:hypothetical protein